MQSSASSLVDGDVENSTHEVHVLIAEAAAYVPAVQLTQVDVPIKALYLPGPQAEQVPPPAELMLPVNPALHKHKVPEVLPAGDVEETGHHIHAVAAAALKDPTKHWEQSPLPSTSLYLPAGQI